MTKPHRKKLRSEPGANRVSDEAFRRGQALLHIIGQTRDIVEFAADSGIHVTSLWSYVNGEVDLATIQQKTVEKLLGTLGVTDTWAWQYFDIPKDARPRWRTFRRPPLGHGDDPRDLYELHLQGPTSGQYVFWAGDILTIDRGNLTAGVLVAVLETGQVAVGPERTLPRDAEIIGQLVRMSPSLDGAGRLPPAPP